MKIGDLVLCEDGEYEGVIGLLLYEPDEDGDWYEVRVAPDIVAVSYNVSPVKLSLA